MSDVPPLPKNKKADAPSVCKCLLKCCEQCYEKEDVKAYGKRLAAGINKRYVQLKKEQDRVLNEPPKMPTGMCLICNSKIIPEHVREPTRDVMHMPIGPASKNYYAWRFKGYHCEGCGLMYKFPPKVSKEQSKP